MRVEATAAAAAVAAVAAVVEGPSGAVAVAEAVGAMAAGVVDRGRAADGVAVRDGERKGEADPDTAVGEAVQGEQAV
jgi:hypothetical protein